MAWQCEYRGVNAVARRFDHRSHGKLNDHRMCLGEAVLIPDFA
jgi:hypothetical protein